MRKIFLSLAIFATALVGAAQAEASLGVIPSMTTYSTQVKDAPAVVKARIVELVNTPVTGINGDAHLHRQNVDDISKRRDLKLEITKVFRTANGVENVVVGEFTVVSPEQRTMAQLPTMLQEGQEAIFFLTPRGDTGLWELRGNLRGVMTEAGAESLVTDLVSYRTDAEQNEVLNASEYFSKAQDRMLSEVSKLDQRLATDALIDFGWNFKEYAGHFTAEESASLLSLLEDTTSGSLMRNELITAIGRTTPAGGQAALVNLVASDNHASTTNLGAWALEQYGRGSSSNALLDTYVEETDDANRASLVRALGLIRPKSYRASEANARSRFVEVLRSSLKMDESSIVLKEALIAARDMRFVNDEVQLNLAQLLQEFRAGLITDDRVYKRAIVAMAAARSETARTYLTDLKGEYSGKYDKHIDLAMQMPFHTLVDYR